jgi:hypothetical protein
MLSAVSRVFFTGGETCFLTSVLVDYADDCVLPNGQILEILLDKNLLHFLWGDAISIITKMSGTGHDPRKEDYPI